jgi:hypothetical protein
LRLPRRPVIVFSFSCMKVIFVLGFALMTSCAVMQSSMERKLTGEWRYTDKIQSCHYVFQGNGAFSGEVIYHQKLISKFTGRWSVKDDVLLYHYTSDALDRIPAGTMDRDQLLIVQKDFFVIQAANGSRRRYSRINEAETH